MIEDIDKIMKEVAEGSDRIIVNPSDLEMLIRQGVPFDVVPSPTIGELFDQRKEKAYLKAQFLPALPQGLPPAIQSLYQEIRECIFFGLNGAAITMSSILIEYALKDTTFIQEVGGYQNIDTSKWDEFENMEFAPAINRAKRVGLIDKNMTRRLHDFRNSIRNNYAHYNIKKITANVVARKVKRVDLNTGKIEEIDIEAKDSPMIQTQAKPFMDEHLVIDVFKFADEVVKYVYAKINAGFKAEV